MRSRKPIQNPFVFLWKNRDTLLLALLLAIAVWVSAVYANDPNQERVADPNVKLEIIGLSESFVIINSVPPSVEVRLRAPASIWATLSENPDMLTAELDLSAVRAGEQTVPVKLNLALSPAQILSYQPMEVTVTADRLVVRDDLPLALIQLGANPQGFLTDSAIFEVSGEKLERVEVSGPSSRMENVTRVIGEVSIEGQRQSLTQSVMLHAVNDQGEIIAGVTVAPAMADAHVVIVQAGKYKDVAIVVETIGEPANGYERTTVDADPLIVTLYAENEEDIADIPGYVSTLPIPLTGKSESFVTQVELNLPPNVRLADEGQIVAASIGIEPKVKSIIISAEIKIRDLPPGLAAKASPNLVEVSITGPEPVINALLPSDLIVFVSLEGAELGTQFVSVQSEILVGQIEVISINPDSVEVIVETATNITPSPTPKPSSTPTPGN